MRESRGKWGMVWLCGYVAVCSGVEWCVVVCGSTMLYFECSAPRK